MAFQRYRINERIDKPVRNIAPGGNIVLKACPVAARVGGRLKPRETLSEALCCLLRKFQAVANSPRAKAMCLLLL